MSKSNRLTREAKALARRENISLSVAKRKIMSGTAPTVHEPVREPRETIPRVAIMPVCPVIRSREQAAEQHGGIELPLGIGPDGHQPDRASARALHWDRDPLRPRR